MRRSLLTPIEQRWCDEVLYLHSLWRRGPPYKSSNPSPTLPLPKPKPKPTSTPITNILPPSNSTSFKKQKKKKIVTLKKKIITLKKKIITRKKKKTVQDSDPPPAPNPWESIPVSQMETGWPDPLSIPELPPVSAEDQERYNAIHLQRKSLQSSQDYFSKNRDDDEDDDSMEVDSEEENNESEEAEFFLEIFKQDNELREYYEKNYEKGVFCCLVCGGIREKVGKRFMNCVALVQHSIAISKTKRRSAHRAFGKAVCQVLGWNIDRLPSIVLSLDEPLGRLLENADTQVGLNKDENGNHEKQILDNTDGN